MQEIDFELDDSLHRFVPKPVAWCWKRDDLGRSRTILFKPHLRFSHSRIILARFDLFYRQSGPRQEMELLFAHLERAQKANGALLRSSAVRDTDSMTIELRTNRLSKGANDIVPRLLALHPRACLPEGQFPAPCETKLRVTRPFALYCGSGVSYEAGLPTLGHIHEHFFVDNMRSERFTFGLDDRLPQILASDIWGYVKESTQFYIDCARAAPTGVHRRIRELQESGILQAVYSDNIDSLLEKAGVRTDRVRTPFPHHRGVSLPTVDLLLVVGVAADRRGIIEKARKSMEICVVNPMSAVSPRAQNLSYLTKADVWYKMTARSFFEERLELFP